MGAMPSRRSISLVSRGLVLGVLFTAACASCGRNSADGAGNALGNALETQPASRSPSDAGPGGGSVVPGASGCQPLVVQAGAKVDGTSADTFTWYDDQCLPRTASLFRNDAADAFQECGGYLRVISYQAAGKTRTLRGTGVDGWQGFGYIVSHFPGDAVWTRTVTGGYRTVLAGRHHAIHEFKWDISPGGLVHVTVHWMFSTGRSHPLFAITLDASATRDGTLQADARAPYGELAWDKGALGDVSGDGWGDTHKFTTTGNGPVTPTSSWDYTKTNTIPYAYEWSASTDSEMGLVSTLSWASRIAGGDYRAGRLTRKWGKTGTNLLTDIPNWEWPFQLNQYELPSVTTSHRIGWGATYGAVGSSSYKAFGQTLGGYPYQSYTVYVVLGTHAPSAVAAQVAAVEATQGVSIAATRGDVAIEGPGGPARTDQVRFPQTGFDPVYAAWTVDAASNAATVTLHAGAATIANPMFEIRRYTGGAPATVSYAGRALVADADYFATVDPAGHRLWITLNQTVSGSGTLIIN